MMAPKISAIDIQHAWQTAFQLRTCPDNIVLRAASVDENLSRHLDACAICREKRAMPVEQVNAWQSLFSKFAPLVHQAVNTPHPGQVWVLKNKLSCWGDDGYYYSPPNVLILEKLDDKHAFRVAQLYSDERLMGEGDVWLGDRFGFAQGWNSYTIHQDALECWLGNVTESQVAEVIHAGALKYAPVEEHSILSFFRKLEITVGAYAALPLAGGLVESAEESVFDLAPGLKLAVSGAKDFVLDIAAGTLDLLRGTFKPAMVLRGGVTRSAAAKLAEEQKKLVLEYCRVIPVDLKVVGDTLTVTLKWLWEKPIEVPAVKVDLNGAEVLEAFFASTTADKIVIQHQSLSTVSTSQMISLKFSFFENVCICKLRLDGRIDSER